MGHPREEGNEVGVNVHYGGWCQSSFSLEKNEVITDLSRYAA
jgi:hypothetical protein